MHVPVSIFAIVVIYRVAPMESASVASLLAAIDAAQDLGLRLHVRIADNTPGGQATGLLPEGVEYRAYVTNPGLAEPYNDALAAAESEGFNWLLTLDQDTNLPTTFLSRMAVEAQQSAANAAIAAVVPHMVDGDRPISPLCYRGGFLPVVLPATEHGVAPRHASAINSGSLLRCTALRAVGGYDPEFPLHNSDTRLYQKLDHAGLRIAVADVTVPHELSILAREQRIRPERYRRMLEDECAFWDRHMGALGRAERIVRLAGRMVKSFLGKEDPAFRRITGNELRRRLLTPRNQRVQVWTND